MHKTNIFLLLLVPSFCFGASFNCDKAVSLSEKMICNDAELSQLDEELGVIFEQAKFDAAKKDNQTLKTLTQQARSAWKWREENCQTKECLVSWFANRKTTLQKESDVNKSSIISDNLINKTENQQSNSSTTTEDIPTWVKVGGVIAVGCIIFGCGKSSPGDDNSDSDLDIVEENKRINAEKNREMVDIERLRMQQERIQNQ